MRFFQDPNQGNDANNDVAQESVDLLQMVPEVGRPRAQNDVSSLHSMKSHDTPQKRMRVYLLQDEETEHDEPETLHICQSCRDNSIYYSKHDLLRSGHYDTRAADTAHQHTPDGSVYFSYLQLANKSRNGSTTPGSTIDGAGGCRAGPTAGGAGCMYEPVDQSCFQSATVTRQNDANAQTQAAKRRSASAGSVFSCCKSAKLTPRRKTLRKCSKSHEEDHVTYSTRATSAAASSPRTLLNNNRMRKRREWSRIRRLLFLAGIISGILIALGGVIVGFVVLAPSRNKSKYAVAMKVTCHTAMHTLEAQIFR